MDKKYLLPSLKEQATIQNVTCWEKIQKPYEFLLDNIKLYYEPVNSIFDDGSNVFPHMYEQMLVFHKAFLNDTHPDHHRAVLEWQMVLILMALQRIQNIQLSLKKIDINEDSSNAFFKAANLFRPKDEPVFYNTTWDFMYVLCLKNNPIAIFSPITIVCPAKEFIKKIGKELENEIIKLDRINGEEKYFLNVEEKAVAYENIATWLNCLESNLSCNNPSNSDCNKRSDKVKKELTAFIKECESYGNQNIKIDMKKDIYFAINNNIRKEYEFLNFCCDFVVPKKLSFLVEKYKENIFEEKLVLILYDNTPDSLDKEENIVKLENVFKNVLFLNGESMLFVRKYGGERMPACVLLPFKDRFIKELIEHRITPEEFFGNFSVIYDNDHEEIKLSLQIIGFPYSFRKIYAKANWVNMYAADMPETYLWPNGQINALDWKAYYIYAKSSNIKVSVPKEDNMVDYRMSSDSKDKNEFRLIYTNGFPAYLKYSATDISGYIPVKTISYGCKNVGGTMEFFIDMGHSTTYLAMVKRVAGDEEKVELVPFEVSPSLHVVGENHVGNGVDYNFVTSDVQKRLRAYFKNMMNCFNNYTRESFGRDDIEPFGRGQIIFDLDLHSQNQSNSNISFLNFEYDKMNRPEKIKSHTFIEELILYVAEKAAASGCDYLKINYINSGYKNSSYGELYGLWENALNWVRHWTGIRRCNINAINSLEEYKALAYSVYRHIKSEKLNLVDDIYIGVDVGWKKTLLTFLMSEKSDDLVDVSYTSIPYAGKDISLMQDDGLESDDKLNQYPEMLSILLDSYKDSYKDSKFSDILENFSKVYITNDKYNKEYYQGIYDVIAQLIEEVNFQISPDVYNNIKEFRMFIGIITYNILLLFLNIGYLLGKVQNGKKHVHIYMSGNGTKFLKWISNEKYCNVIDKTNNHTTLILQLQHCILDIIKMGSKIIESDCDYDIEIILEDNPKEKILEGYIYKEFPVIFTDNSTSSEFTFHKLDNGFQNEQDFQQFMKIFDIIESDVFGNMEILNEKTDSFSGTMEKTNADKDEQIAAQEEDGEAVNLENQNGKIDNLQDKVEDEEIKLQEDSNKGSDFVDTKEADIEAFDEVAASLESIGGNMFDAINIKRRCVCKRVITNINHM